MATDTRERILSTAARLFHEQGYHATGVATIQREAEVSSGSFYNFFPSKEDLLVGVLERYVEILRPAIMDPAEAAADDPLQRIFALLAGYRVGLESTGCAMGCPLGNLALELSDNHPRIRELIDLNFRNWAAVVRGWLDQAADRLPADVDRDGLAHFVLTVMEGGIMQARAAKNLDPFDAAVDQLADYFNRLVDAAARDEPTPGDPAHA